MGARIHAIRPGGYIDLPRAERDAPAEAMALLARAGVSATDVIAIKMRPLKRIDAKTIGDRYAYEDEYDQFDRSLTKAGFRGARVRGVVGKLTRAGINAREDGKGTNARVWTAPITCVAARHESGLELFLPMITHHAPDIVLAAETLNSIIKICEAFIAVVKRATNEGGGQRHFNPKALSIETRSGVQARLVLEIPLDADEATVRADLEQALAVIFRRNERKPSTPIRKKKSSV